MRTFVSTRIAAQMAMNCEVLIKGKFRSFVVGVSVSLFCIALICSALTFQILSAGLLSIPAAIAQSGTK
jgi:hypothetical protein